MKNNEEVLQQFQEDEPDGLEKMRQLFAKGVRENSDGLMIGFQGNTVVGMRRPSLSPVPNLYEMSNFASSLMSLSEREMRQIEFVYYTSEPMLWFLGRKLKNLTMKEKLLFISHIPSLKI